MRWINIRPSRATALTLALLPFGLLVAAYLTGSAARLAVNPGDKLLPGLVSIADAINRMAFIPDARTGDLLLWSDTLASLSRLGWGLSISTLIALVIGMIVGMLPVVRSLLAPVIAVIAMVPPLALLPILFILLGLGETAKIALIVIGVAPTMIRDLALKVGELPREQIVKAETLGGSSWQIALRVVLPQILPRLITCLRLQLGPAWLFLIAAEAISSDAGLGYRIFLVRRYLSMDVIFPYVAWITLLAVLMNLALDGLRVAVFPLVQGGEHMSDIVIDNVWKEYGDQIVLEKVSLHIESRAFVALVGPSGCGKTTFLRLLLGEESPTQGSITIDGTPLLAEPSPDRGVVFQRYSVFSHLTVLGNVLLGKEFAGSRFAARLLGAKRRAAIDEARALIAEVGLAGAEDKFPAMLSGGMQQRLALAQALIMRPKVLLLDEPFGALDPGIRAEIHVLMKRLWHETALTVVMVTHDLREAFTLAARVIAFERPRDRPEERERYGATLRRDISIWPPRVAGELPAFALDRDDPATPMGPHRDDPAPLEGAIAP